GAFILTLLIQLVRHRWWSGRRGSGPRGGCWRRRSSGGRGSSGGGGGWGRGWGWRRGVPAFCRRRGGPGRGRRGGGGGGGGGCGRPGAGGAAVAGSPAPSDWTPLPRQRVRSVGRRPPAAVLRSASSGRSRRRPWAPSAGRKAAFPRSTDRAAARRARRRHLG